MCGIMIGIIYIHSANNYAMFMLHKHNGLLKHKPQKLSFVVSGGLSFSLFVSCFISGFFGGYF